jgi:predicted nucleic acid-binding protein
VASAESTYVDPSALIKLYFRHRDSAAISAWRARLRGPLPVTPHGRLEILNGLCQAVFRRDITPAALRDALASVDEDFADGRYVHADILWRSALRRADDLSREYTPAIGCRALDVLHVACAQELGLPNFLTFDLRQQRLARSVGLKRVSLRAS